MSSRCRAQTRAGRRCRNTRSKLGGDCCSRHAETARPQYQQLQRHVPRQWWSQLELIYKQLQSLPMQIQNLLAYALPGEDTSDRSLWEDLFAADEKPHATPEFVESLREVKEENGDPVEVQIDRQFQNWGLTIKVRPAVTFVPRSIVGIQNIVKWSRQHKMRIRCSAYRHTWNSQFADEGQVLISMLPLPVVEKLPSLAPPMEMDHFQFARLLGTKTLPGGQIRGLCHIGAATTMEQLRVWSSDMAPGGGECKWSLPCNVVMVEITIVGAILNMCHGAGWKQQTLSDLVESIEFVDGNATVQTVSDPSRIQALAGSFGVMGVVTSVVLRLVPMQYVNLHPRKLLMTVAIPPLRDSVPILFAKSKLHDKQEEEKAQAEFERHCEEDYYCEWFWFPGQEQAWLNCFTADGDPALVEHYPSDWLALTQWVQSWVCERLLLSFVADAIPAATQANLLGETAMRLLPEKESGGQPMVTYLSDALHFRKGIQNTRIRNFEMAIPIPEAGGKPDWTICNRAWWDALEVVDRFGEEAPLRLSLEMRITGDSRMLLAPQAQNKCGTCTIEVISTLNVPDEVWLRFKQALLDKWAAYKDGKDDYLLIRPHWAKEWYGDLNVRGEPIMHYMKRIYKEPIKEFHKRNNPFDSLFSNRFLDLLFLS